MQITTIIFALVCLVVWNLHPLIVSLLLPLICLEGLFLSANLTKVPGRSC